MHIPAPCSDDVDIVYEDEAIVVVNKPAGLLSIPGRYLRDSVLHRIFFEYPGIRIVHRLDMDTSGVMVLARSKPAARELSRQFRERQVEKTYEAVVWGRVEESEGEVDAPLSADPDRKPFHRVDPANGKPARTRFKTVQASRHRSHLLLSPLTGRSHQLRVHMAYIGHPILGCDLYAHPAAFEAATRLMLHARVLRFTHPVSGKVVLFEVPAGWGPTLRQGPV